MLCIGICRPSTQVLRRSRQDKIQQAAIPGAHGKYSRNTCASAVASSSRLCLMRGRCTIYALRRRGKTRRCWPLRPCSSDLGRAALRLRLSLHVEHCGFAPVRSSGEYADGAVPLPRLNFYCEDERCRGKGRKRPRQAEGLDEVLLQVKNG